MRITSISNVLSYDPVTYEVTSPSQDWLEEGFRPNDWVLIRRLDSGGGVISDEWNQIQSVSNQICDFVSAISFYDFTLGEIMEFYVVTAQNIYTKVEKDEVDVILNHTLNDTPGVPSSLIDGEVTKIRFSSINGSSVGVPIAGIPLGYQSGQMLISSSITKLAPTDSFFRYQIDLEFVNTGMYDDGTWFLGPSCLKAYISQEWARVSGEPYARQSKVYAESADTGYYDEPFNFGVANSELIQGLSEVSYCDTTSHSIVVDGPTTDLQIGACYLSIDDTYYKNKITNQLNLSMVIPSTDLVVGSLLSAVNPDGAQYEISVTNINSVGSETTIDLDIIPNADFDTFMEGRDSGDRKFLLWVKCGSQNLLANDVDMICIPPPADPLLLQHSVEYLDHSQNYTYEAVDLDYRDFNTEDDLASYNEFLLEKGVIYEQFNVYIEGRNTVTNDRFTLKTFSFSFDGVQISGDGRYLLDESIAVNSGLPSTSEKINSLFKLQPALDTLTEYGVSIYIPVLLDWRYWLPQNNVSTDFYPNQNKNWQQYDGSGDWQVQIRLELVRDGLGHNHSSDINILDYDSEPLINSDIQLYIDATNTNVGVVTEGELMRIVATHTLISGNWQAGVWGMITVEPKEIGPRKIISTAIPYDYDSSNPLKPIDNVAMTVTFPSPNVARMECHFNPDLIDLSNGVKFTSKIKQTCIEEPVFKTMTDGTIKTTTTGENKTIAN
jgi:hypothetical protein